MARNRLDRSWIPITVISFISLSMLAMSPDRSASGQNDNDQEPQVLTRGPVHEAFAEPIVFDAKPGPIVAIRPPEPVEELPPDEKPDGENVAWIPGYWHWDDDRKDYLWVSGFWRMLPPGRQWVPGYWSNLEGGGTQWISGYWSASQSDQVEYLPAPPGSLETGAASEPPTENHTWVPGSWVWRESRYLWRPGYWIVAQPGWIWTPAHYTYTPCGYVFVDGYWDYSIRRRGVLFAPIFWNRYVYRPNYFFRPRICIDVDILTAHFFCRPMYRHYYFGDYYGSTYVSLGFTPWFQFRYTRGVGYHCPIYSYHAWYYRSRDPRWEANIQLGYRRAFDDMSYRPPRTYIAQQNIINNVTINTTTVNNQFNKIVMARPYAEVTAHAARDSAAPMHFRRLDEQQVQQYRNQGRETRNFISQREEWERKTAARLPRMGSGQATSPKITQPVKLDLPKAPIASRNPVTQPPTQTLPRRGGAGTGESNSTDANTRPNITRPGGIGTGGTGQGNDGKPVTLPEGGNRPPLGGTKPERGPGIGSGSTDNKLPTIPPTGGNRPPLGGTRPERGPDIGSGSSDNKLPTIPPTGGNRPPLGGTRPERGPDIGSGSSGNKPPTLPPSGGNRPPAGGSGK